MNQPDPVSPVPPSLVATDQLSDELVEVLEENESTVASTDPQNQDPRHQRRIKLMQALFAYGFSNSVDHLDPDLVNDIQETVADLSSIDELLQSAAPERPLADINKVDLAILRLIMFESRHKKTPKKVLLDEAVELAKEFGTESSPAFVNGVLGKLLM